MKQELATEFFKILDLEVQSRPSVVAFEMAYQARIAIERIKFAIKHTERLANHPGQAMEANLQLLDALDRLQSAEQHFQQSWRKAGPILAGISDSYTDRATSEVLHNDDKSAA